MKFAVWVDGWNEREIVAGEPEYAAEKYVEALHGDLDYPSEVEVNVRDEAGAVERFRVIVESSPTFYAMKVDGPKD